MKLKRKKNENPPQTECVLSAQKLQHGMHRYILSHWILKTLSSYNLIIIHSGSLSISSHITLKKIQIIISYIANDKSHTTLQHTAESLMHPPKRHYRGLFCAARRGSFQKNSTALLITKLYNNKNRKRN